MARLFAILLLAGSAIAGSVSVGDPKLVLPDEWVGWTDARQASHLTALLEQLRLAHNATSAKDPTAARQTVMPRVRLVAAKLAALRLSLPAVKGDFALRWNRPAELAKMTVEQKEAADPVKAFPAETITQDGPDPTEDFTGYTETDPGTDITVAAAKITCDTMALNQDSYVYLDKTAAHFANFTHTYEFVPTGNSPATVYHVAWGVSNTVDDGQYWSDNKSQAAHGFIYYASPEWWYYLRDTEDGTGDQDGCVITGAATTYCTAIRSGTALTVACYSNSARTTLIDTLAVTLAAGRTYRYIFAVGTFNVASANTISSTFSNLDLGEAAASTVPLHILNRNVPHLRGGPTTPWRTGP